MKQKQQVLALQACRLIEAALRNFGCGVASGRCISPGSRPVSDPDGDRDPDDWDRYFHNVFTVQRRTKEDGEFKILLRYEVIDLENMIVRFNRKDHEINLQKFNLDIGRQYGWMAGAVGGHVDLIDELKAYWSEEIQRAST